MRKCSRCEMGAHDHCVCQCDVCAHRFDRLRGTLSELEQGALLTVKAHAQEKIARLQAEERAAGLAKAGSQLLASLGEYVRQSMYFNPEWRDGIVAMEAALAPQPADEQRLRHVLADGRCKVCGVQFANGLAGTWCSGTPSRAALGGEEQVRKLSEVQRSILSAFTVGYDLFSRISLYNMCSDAGSYEAFGRQLQALRKRGLIIRNHPTSACWRITDAGRAALEAAKEKP